jgi:hypothetical protein
MSFKARALLLSLVALLLASAIAPGAVYAGAGPFWHHREVGAKGEGENLSTTPEPIQGEGGVQTIKMIIGSMMVEMEAKGLQIKGAIYNNSLQGQGKFSLAYHEIKVVKPELKGCEARLGTTDVVKLTGHLAWKWDGTKKQLEESSQKTQTPGWIFGSGEIAEGATELPKDGITTLSLVGTGCGVLASTVNTEGSIAGEMVPTRVEEWGRTQKIVTLEGKRAQHLWNGKGFIGVGTEFTQGGKPAGLLGEDVIETKAQEVAVFE